MGRQGRVGRDAKALERHLTEAAKLLKAGVRQATRAGAQPSRTGPAASRKTKLAVAYLKQLTLLLPQTPSILPLREAENTFREAYVAEVVGRMNGNKQWAAVLLDVDLRTIQRILFGK